MSETEGTPQNILLQVFSLQVIVGMIVVASLTACVSQEEIRKRVKESDGYYKEGISFLETDPQRRVPVVWKVSEGRKTTWVR